jgi:hypothetical protein
VKNFDDLLDGVLSEDATAQPRAGLEGRVMARLQGERQRRSVWSFVTWGLVAAALPVCFVVLLVWPKNMPPVQHVKEVPAISGSAVPKQVAMEPERNQPRTVARTRISVRRESKRVVDEAESLPKLDVFPTPAEVDMFPQPVKANEGRRQLAELKSKKVGEALTALQQEQSEPIRIAAIEIAPLQTDGNSQRDR